MTPFASVALFKREGKLTFKAPRKEPHANVTQARKSAARYWHGNITEPDKLHRVLVVQSKGGMVHVAERLPMIPNKPWVTYSYQPAEAWKMPHIAACLAELAVTRDEAPAVLPDTLEINGVIYRREI